MAKFFSIHNSIFNADDVVAIHQQTRKVEVEKTVAVVHVQGKEDIEEHVVYLPEGKQISDFLEVAYLNDSIR